jgi:hypothetical protein
MEESQRKRGRDIHGNSSHSHLVKSAAGHGAPPECGSFELPGASAACARHRVVLETIRDHIIALNNWLLLQHAGKTCQRRSHLAWAPRGQAEGQRQPWSSFAAHVKQSVPRCGGPRHSSRCRARAPYLAVAPPLPPPPPPPPPLLDRAPSRHSATHAPRRAVVPALLLRRARGGGAPHHHQQCALQARRTRRSRRIGRQGLYCARAHADAAQRPPRVSKAAAGQLPQGAQQRLGRPPHHPSLPCRRRRRAAPLVPGVSCPACHRGGCRRHPTPLNQPVHPHPHPCPHPPSYGLDLFLLSIDEGISGYRDDSLETVKRNEATYGGFENGARGWRGVVVGARFWHGVPQWQLGGGMQLRRSPELAVSPKDCAPQAPVPLPPSGARPAQEALLRHQAV